MTNNLAVSLSILLNALLAGKRYEMLSSRAYRCDWWFAASIIDWWFWLLFGEPAHCQVCFERQRTEGVYDI